MSSRKEYYSTCNLFNLWLIVFWALRQNIIFFLYKVIAQNK